MATVSLTSVVHGLRIRVRSGRHLLSFKGGVGRYGFQKGALTALNVVAMMLQTMLLQLFRHQGLMAQLTCHWRWYASDWVDPPLLWPSFLSESEHFHVIKNKGVQATNQSAMKPVRGW